MYGVFRHLSFAVIKPNDDDYAKFKGIDHEPQ